VSKIILHLCADIGSDSRFFDECDDFEVIKIGKEIGVENYNPPSNIYGVIANPPCTEFSTARANGKARNPNEGMFLVEQCMRIIEECNPKFWVIENPARGVLKKYLGDPQYKYEPWWYGSPWTKQTALWGQFNIPKRTYSKWEDVPKLDGLYTRPGRGKPSLAFMHKSHIQFIPEFEPFKDIVHCDMHFRSLCSQKFAKAFFEANKSIEDTVIANHLLS
jgi:hypothetical protein